MMNWYADLDSDGFGDASDGCVVVQEVGCLTIRTVMIWMLQYIPKDLRYVMRVSTTIATQN